MKGQPISLQVPTRGVIRNTPPHLVGREAVVDGENMLMTLDGRYGCRPGYVNYGAQGDLGEAPRGGIFFRDVNQSPQMVVAGPTAWARYNATTDAWSDITPSGDPLTGNVNNPVRFTTYAQAGAVWAVGANNADRLKRWEPTLAEYTEIVAAPIARDVTVLANRLVVFNTEESSVRNATRIRWSSAADMTTWPALGFNDLDLAGEEGIGIAPLTRFAAALYREESIWLLHAQSGGDATAFAPERVSSGNIGPASPAAIVRAGRIHYYLGRDSKVYRFDGVEPVVISGPITGLLNDVISPAYWGRMHGTFYPRRREVWWWVVRRDETEPKTAFVYNIDAQRWETEQKFTIGVTTSIRAEDQREGSWAADSQPWSSDNTSWDAETGEPYLIILLGASTSTVQAFGYAPDDGGAAINFSWKLPMTYAGEVSQMIFDRVESFFTPVTTQTPTVDVKVYSVAHPMATPVLQHTGALNLASLDRLISGERDSSFNNPKYTLALQVEYSGSTLNAQNLRWGGGTLSANVGADGDW